MRSYDALVYADEHSDAFAAALAEATAADLVAVLRGRADLGVRRRELLTDLLATDPRFEDDPDAAAWLTRILAAERTAADSLVTRLGNGLDLRAEHLAAILAGDRRERYYAGLGAEQLAFAGGGDDWGN